MSELEVSDGVGLFMQQASAINSLWGVFVAATFAGAGYGISSSALPVAATAAVTVGFLLFAIGHWSLLWQALTVNRVLGRDLLRAAEAGKAGGFEDTIRRLAGTANPAWVSTAIHLLIDGCVVLALWSRPLNLLPPGHH